MRYYEHCLAQQNALTSDFYHYVYVLEPYVETALKNQTNTFLQISVHEATLLY